MLCMQPIVLNCIYHPRKLALSRFTIWRFFVFSVLLRLAEQRLLLQPYFSAAFMVVLIDLFIFRWLIRCNFWTLVNPALNFLLKKPTLPSQYFMMGELKEPNYYVYELDIRAIIIECCDSRISPRNIIAQRHTEQL